MKNPAKKNNKEPKNNNIINKQSVLAFIFLSAFGMFFLYLWVNSTNEVEVTQQPGQRILKPEERQKRNVLIGPHIPPETRMLYNYSQRLEDTNNLMWTLLVTVMHETMKNGKQPADLPTVVELAKQRSYNGSSLWMARWELSPDKHAVKTDVGYNLIAYRADPLSIEIRNVPFEDGSQVLLMRVPEADGSPLMANPDLSQSRTVAGVLLLISPPNGAFYPPFTPKQNYLLSNWREEPIKLSLDNSPERQAIITRWIDEASKPNRN